MEKDLSGRAWARYLVEPQLKVPKGYIRLAGPIEHDSIVNGPGLRAVIWTQGCRQHCPGCQNPETWTEDEEVGALTPIREVKESLRKMRGQAGVTFCGGEPLLQGEACAEIARFAREELGLKVWSFTGLVFEDIPRDSAAWRFVLELDALIDGPFVLAQKDLTLKFRGSKNQRLLKLKRGKILSIE